MFQSLATFLLVLSLAQGALASQCPDLVSTLQGSIDSQSIDQKIQNLSELKLSLDLAKVNGTSSIDFTAMKAHYETKEQDLAAYLEKNEIMSRKQLLEKMKQQIAALQSHDVIEQARHNRDKEEEVRRKKEQEALIKESVVDGRKAISHRINHGSFMMGEVGKQVPVTLTKSFDMMATATTQLFYKTIAALANAKFSNRYKIDTDPSEFQGDLNPVEKVSYNEVQVWIQALNELSAIGEPILTDLIPRHKKGDVYRLPTEAEWEFVVRGRGTLNETYHFGDNDSELKDYAWYTANAEGSTHPVAQKKPLIFENKDFYDMHGNVWEWVHDWYNDKLAGGVDPQGKRAGSFLGSKKTAGPFRVVRGGSRFHDTRGLNSAYRGSVSPDDRGEEIGFRIVRTVP